MYVARRARANASRSARSPSPTYLLKTSAAESAMKMPSADDVPTARTFRWLKDGMSRESGGYRIREWDVPDRGQDGGRKLAVVVNEVIKVTAADTGYLFTNIY